MEVSMKLNRYLFICIFTLHILHDTHTAERNTCHALMNAISTQDIEQTRTLLSITKNFPKDFYPLHYAIEQLNIHIKNSRKTLKAQWIIQLLIDYGLKKNEVDTRGQTPLDIVTAYKNKPGIEFFKALLQEDECTNAFNPAPPHVDRTLKPRPSTTEQRNTKNDREMWKLLSEPNYSDLSGDYRRGDYRRGDVDKKASPVTDNDDYLTPGQPVYFGQPTQDTQTYEYDWPQQPQ